MKVGPRFGDLATDADRRGDRSRGRRGQALGERNDRRPLRRQPREPGRRTRRRSGSRTPTGPTRCSSPSRTTSLEPERRLSVRAGPDRDRVRHGDRRERRPADPRRRRLPPIRAAGRASTGADGTYSLRLRPGTYVLSFSADDYVTHEESGVIVTDGGSLVVDAALDAPVAGVEPTEIDASVDFGDSATSTDHDLQHGLIRPHVGAVGAGREPHPARPPAGAAGDPGGRRGDPRRSLRGCARSGPRPCRRARWRR